jgi:hypothetical protein
MYTEALFHTVVADRARARNRSVWIDTVRDDQPVRAPRRIVRSSPAYLRGIPASVWRAAMSRTCLPDIRRSPAGYGSGLWMPWP